MIAGNYVNDKNMTHDTDDDNDDNDDAAGAVP